MVDLLRESADAIPAHDRFDHSSIKDFTVTLFFQDSCGYGRPDSGGGVFSVLGGKCS